VRLARDGDRLRVIGVEVGAGAVLRRLGLRRLSGRHRENPLDWKGIHLASGRGHALQLSSSSSGAHRLAPDELVELVARLPTDRAAEILAAVPPELAADALGRARPGLGARVVRALVPKKAGTIVELMASDDAAAALRHLRPAELDKLLAAVDSARAADLRRLLAHPAHTAAGLMNPDVITASSGDDIATIRARLAAGAPLLDALLTVFVVDSDRRLLGVVTPRAQNVGDTRPTPTPSVHQGAPIDEVVGLFALHDILALPVVDDDGHLLGAVAIDDVLEELLAERLPGRRRFRTVRERRR
jgi:Mg/Co/Ni transporter MgtE